MKRRLVTLSILLCLACGRVERTNLLPWFMIKTTRYPNVGGFGGGQRTTEYYIKSYGLWRRLEGWGAGAVALNPETVVFFARSQAQIIHPGERQARPACGEGFFFATIARRSESIDCVQVLEGKTQTAGSRIRYRRVDRSGRVTKERSISVEAPGREFMGAQVRFYDDRENPFFVTGREWPYTTPECAIIDENGRSLAAPEGIRASDCADPGFWSKVLQRRIY